MRRRPSAGEQPDLAEGSQSRCVQKDPRRPWCARSQPLSGCKALPSSAFSDIPLVP